MTKMQIIAKAVLAGLGFYLLGLIMHATQRAFYNLDYITNSMTVIGLALCIIAIIFVILFRIFRNDKLARDIAGPGEVLDARRQRIWLIISLRLSVVFTGLFLLARSMQLFVSLSHKLFFFLPQSREWASRIMNSNSISDGLAMFFAGPLSVFHNICLAAMIIYLLAGAPHLVKWQIEHSVKSNTNPERSDDE